MVATHSSMLPIRTKAPYFQLEDVSSGKIHEIKKTVGSKGHLVAFICNHCPVAQAYETRLNRFAKRFAESKRVAFVAINSSIEESESIDAMKKRAKQQGFRFPYLRDPEQKVARAFGATVTPHLFVLDQNRRIAYMGAFDDNFVEDRVEEHYVADAVDALLSGRRPEVKESRQRGCEIQYRGGRKPGVGSPGTSSPEIGCLDSELDFHCIHEIVHHARGRTDAGS